MFMQSLLHSSQTSFYTHKPRFLSQSLPHFKKPCLSLAPGTCPTLSRGRLVAQCTSQSQEIVNGSVSENEPDIASNSEENKEDEKEMEKSMRGLESQSLWQQIKEIVMFTAPATGLWICGPLMSLIDTAVIGQGSSLELAALGMCFMTFLGFMILTALVTRSVENMNFESTQRC